MTIRSLLAASFVILLGVLAASSARAHTFLGWMPIAAFHVDATCTKRACTVDVPTEWRHPRVAFVTDAPLGANLGGQVVFACEGGSEQTAPLPSIPAAGGVATVPNPCPAFAARRIGVRVESVSLPGADDRRGAMVRVFGAVN
jgi:hypothetical protein